MDEVTNQHHNTVKNENSVSDEYNKLLAHAKSFLPFIKTVINCSDNLGIPKEHLNKLQALYEMVADKKLSLSRLKSCQDVISNLYNKYYKLIKNQTKVDNPLEFLQLNCEKNKTNSIDVNLTSNKNDQKPSSKLISSISVTEHNVMNQLKSLEQNSVLHNKEFVSDSFSNNSKNAEETCNQNSNKDNSKFANSNLPEFSDSRLRLNKVIRFAANVSIEKLNTSDTNISNSELAQQIYDDMSKQNNTDIYQNLLKDINIDEIDVDCVKKVLENIQNSEIQKPVEPPPLPPTDLMGLAATSIKNVSLVESNVDYVTNDNSTPLLLESQPISNLKSSKISIREKLNKDINILHKIGSSNEPKQKLIATYKPGTLIDLENSKVPSTSLFMESFRPIIKSNEKSNEIKQPSISSISVPRDPRIRNKCLMNNENGSISAYKMKNSNAINNSSFLLSNENRQNITSEQELLHNSMSGYSGQSNFQNLASHNSIQTSNNTIPPEYAGNLNQFKGTNYRSSTPYRNNHNFETSNNDYSRYSSGSQLCSNLTSYDPTMRCRESASSKTYKGPNDIISRRDPRSSRLLQSKKVQESEYRNFREYREAKYGKDKLSNNDTAKNKRGINSHEHDSYNSFISDNDKLKKRNPSIDPKNINPFCNYGVLNESTSIKSFKIPKIKRNEEISNQNIKDFNTETDIKNNEIQENTLTQTNTEDNIKTNSKTDGQDISETLLLNKTCNVNKDYEVKNIAVKEANILKKPVKQLSKPKKPRKYSKEKEFEKIVKEAVESLNDDVFGPRTRTRSSLKKKEEIMKNINFDNPKKSCSLTDDEKCSDLEEKVENSRNKVNKSNEIINKSVETGLNMISSISIDSSEVDSTKFVHKNNEESNVSCNEIISTAELTVTSEVNKLVQDIVSDSRLLNIYKALRDEKKIEKISKLLNDEDMSEDKLSSENISIQNPNEQKKSKKKLKKEKKKRRKINRNQVNNTLSEVVNDKIPNLISEDNNLNKECLVETDVINNLNEDDKVRSGNNHDHLLTDQIIESTKQKKSKDHFEISNNKLLSDIPIKDLKIVITKFDKYDKRINNSSSRVQTINESSNIKNITDSKPKKPFRGPLSVKLARQKMEAEQSHTYVSKKKAKNDYKSNAYVVIKPHVDTCVETATPTVIASVQEEQTTVTNCEQNPDETVSIESNSISHKPESKKSKPKMTELDKLHADISEMFDCAAVLSVPNIRHCRTNKKIDYVNTNSTISPKKNKTSKVNDDDGDDEFIGSKKKLKVIKNKCKGSTLKLKNKKLAKIPNKKECVKTITVINKKQNVLKSSSKLKKRKYKGYKKQKKKKSSKLNTTISHNACNDKFVTPFASKTVSLKSYTDIEYFQAVGISLECKFCYYVDTAFNTVRHYKELHSKDEILSSRLSKEYAEMMINESIKENFAYKTSEDIKSSMVSMNLCFSCVFCQVVFYDFIRFYDHITSHTGEYRYKCKKCEKCYPNENELKEHILDHSNYNTTDGISILIYPNPVQSNILFGYLCSFCNYVQLDYNNTKKHISMWHLEQDKKLNGHWTIIRVNMSMGNENITNSEINYNNLVGCLPPLQHNQNILQAHEDKPEQSISALEQHTSQTILKYKDHASQIKQPSVSELIAETKKKLLQHNAESFKKEFLEHPESLESLPKSNPENTSVINEPVTKTDEPGINNLEYTLKEASTKCIVAGLSCEVINSVLLYKCSASTCEQNSFSTVVLNDFFKHIELSHKFIVWDRKCDTCKHKIEPISDHYFLKDALEHLISYHLDIKEKQQSNLSNPVIVNTEHSCLSTTCQDTDKNIETLQIKPATALRVRSLPGDILSIPKQLSNARENVSFEGESNSLHSSCLSADYTHFNQMSSNVKSNALIINVMSLNESNIINDSKINRAENSINDDTCMWINTGTKYEILLPHPALFPNPGQIIINKGHTQNNIYRFVDLEYKKNYLKRVRELPMHIMKTKLAYYEMTALKKIPHLFKCSDRTCTKSFNSKDTFLMHMKLHFVNLEKRKKNQVYNIEQFKMCIYCFKKFDDEHTLTNHISSTYYNCNYFCPLCFYRAYTASHVNVHQSTIHNKPSFEILKLKIDDECSRDQEISMVIDYNTYVLPYICNVGCCSFSCYVHNDFISHLNQEHQQCDKFCCYICANEDNGEGFFALHPKLMIKHFKLHNINMYQCIFCLYGSENIDSMINHLAMEHFEYDSLCLERSPISNICDTSKIENLKILRVQKIIDDNFIKLVNLPTETEVLPQQRAKKRRLECSDVLSAAMKSAHIDEDSQPSNAIVITIPDKAQMISSSTPLISNIGNEFIMLDDVNENGIEESLKVNTIYSWTETTNNEQESQQSNDDVIIIDDDEDEDDHNTQNTEIPIKRKCILKHSVGSTGGQNKNKRLALPLIPLDMLFNCNKCYKIFSTATEYQSHFNYCQSWDFNGQKCVFCTKTFKTIVNMTEHLKLHGPNRFKCFSCGFYVPSHHAIKMHMKNKHQITNLNLVPIIPNLTDIDKDEFMVYEDSTLKSKVVNYICGKCSLKSSYKKSIILHAKNIHKFKQFKVFDITSPSNNNTQDFEIRELENVIDNTNESSLKLKEILDRTEIKLFCPETILNIPMTHIFSKKMGCSLCNYTSKVRINLIEHLVSHSKGGQITTKEIVNPVPCIGKSELMFDKMINLSASSFEAMNTEKMKINELNKKIVEVTQQYNLNDSIYPTYVSKNNLYRCSTPSCYYIGMTEVMLKKHISILHPEDKYYSCPHCPIDSATKEVELNNIEFHLMLHGENLYSCQYCKYIDFNRNELRTHMREVHLSNIINSNQSNIIVIRQSMLEDVQIDRSKYKAQLVVAQWICKLCSSGIRYTEKEIKSHILLVHNVSNMYKCPMCKFEHDNDDANVFENHYKLQHPSVAVKSIKVFDKVTENENLEKQSKNVYVSSNTLEQQALESIEPSLVPPTCRGIPIEIVSTNKTNNKSRSVPKSPKVTTKSSSVQVYKQKSFVDNFSIIDNLGTISSNGLFVCPRCNVFETTSIDQFRDHLFKDVRYKTWICTHCYEISDSPKKMAWHIKKHKNGCKYEKVESVDKFNWVERVIKHQNSLLIEFNNKQNKYLKEVVEQNNTSVRNDKKSILSPLKRKRDIENENRILHFQTTTNQSEVINLLDSDDE